MRTRFLLSMALAVGIQGAASLSAQQVASVNTPSARDVCSPSVLVKLDGKKILSPSEGTPAKPIEFELPNKQMCTAAQSPQSSTVKVHFQNIGEAVKVCLTEAFAGTIMGGTLSTEQNLGGTCRDLPAGSAADPSAADLSFSTPLTPDAAAVILIHAGPENTGWTVMRFRTLKESKNEQDTVNLDDTGIASWQFLNRRRPPVIATTESSFLTFNNRSAVRTIQVTLNVPNPDLGFLVPSGGGNSTSDIVLRPCAKATCPLVITVQPGSSVKFPMRYLAGAAAATSPVTTFTVSFFREDQTPANATGYLATPRLGPRDEAPSQTTWSVTAGVDALREPGFTSDTEQLTAASPYNRHNLFRHLPASLRTSVAMTMGDRADASVELQVKSGDLGGDDKVKDVRVANYRINAFGVGGMRFSFGRYLVAAPSGAVALRAFGDTVGASYKSLTVNFLMSRESEAGIPDIANRDRKEMVAQLSGLAPKNGGVGVLDVIATYGSERKVGNRATYSVVGGVWSVAPTEAFRASGSLYGNFRWPHREETSITKGRSMAWLLTGVWNSNLAQPTSKRPVLLGGSLAGVSADDDRTELNEGYLGSTSAYAPDALFLAGLAKHLSNVGEGLNNKKIATGYVTFTGVSLFDSIAAALGVPDGDIVSRNVTFKIHNYWQGTSTLGSDGLSLGTEIDLSTQIETPKGVKISGLLGRFAPAGSLRSLLPPSVWIARLGVVIVLK